MWYGDYEDRLKDHGIDYDLFACLDENPQKTFTVFDIKKVWAVWEGERDGDDWRWVLELNSGAFVFLQGGCDYTGWNCQSWATHAFADTLELAAEKALGDISIEESSPSDAGLGHLLSIFSGEYDKNFEDVKNSLLKQIAEGKQKTWMEQKVEEFKVPIAPAYDWTIEVHSGGKNLLYINLYHVLKSIIQENTKAGILYDELTETIFDEFILRFGLVPVDESNTNIALIKWLQENS